MRAMLAQGVNPLVFPGLHMAVSSAESRAINEDPEPKVIISASGMCEAGRIRHHLKYNLWRPESMVLFVGYQAVGTTGRALMDGKKQLKILGDEIGVQAEIAYLPGVSGHADREGLLRWIGAFRPKPRMVFVNHGEDETVKRYAATLAHDYGLTVSAPYSGAVYDLLADHYTEMPEGVPVLRLSARQQRNNTVYSALLDAADKLSRVARACRGIPNKEIARFTGQINSLADKWSSWTKK